MQRASPTSICESMPRYRSFISVAHVAISLLNAAASPIRRPGRQGRVGTLDPFSVMFHQLLCWGTEQQVLACTIVVPGGQRLPVIIARVSVRRSAGACG